MMVRDLSFNQLIHSFINFQKCMHDTPVNSSGLLFKGSCIYLYSHLKTRFTALLYLFIAARFGVVVVKRNLIHFKKFRIERHE